MKLLTKIILCALMATNSYAQDYVVDFAGSKILFSGEHAGNKFEGNFGSWDAQIKFDPSNLKESSLSATFDLSTAKTGNALYDGTLPQADWFDVKNHSPASFQSTSIVATESGYTASGDLTIRGITQPISFDFTVSDLKVSPVKTNGTFKIDRLAYDIGRKSDADAQWVSQEIIVNLEIEANPS